MKNKNIVRIVALVMAALFVLAAVITIISVLFAG